MVRFHSKGAQALTVMIAGALIAAQGVGAAAKHLRHKTTHKAVKAHKAASKPAPTHKVGPPVKTATREFHVASPIPSATPVQYDTPTGRMATGAAFAFPGADMRGYGHVDADYSPISSVNGGSMLRMRTLDVAHAQIVMAKFLSDFQSLPGVTSMPIPGISNLSMLAVQGQGYLAPIRVGANVTVVAAATPSDMERAVKSAIGSNVYSAVSTAETDAPRYLDRWDKYGFRFYYYPTFLPKNQPADQPYDYQSDFEWAKKEKVGLVFWDHLNLGDSAESLAALPWWDWSAKTASQYGLPLAINGTMELAPDVLLNRYRGQNALKMPQFLGNPLGIADEQYGGPGWLSVNSSIAQNDTIALIQSTHKAFVNDPNVVSWLEPHAEISRYPQDLFLEYGPAADAGYRKYLQGVYGSVAALGTAWFGDSGHFKQWEDVTVPEIASFLGWGPGAYDLTGTWRVGYEPFVGKELNLDELRAIGTNGKVDGTTPAPDEWYAPTFDDTGWPTLTAPGNDAMIFTPKRPAVFRRHFTLSSAWIRSHSKVWLYEFDLNRATKDKVLAKLNGVALPESPMQFNTMHWQAIDVSGILQSGENVLTLRVPKGYLAYRVYLSSTPPAEYPNLSPSLNAQWYDFIGWQQWSHSEAVRRGLQEIRSIDPNRPITLMHPDAYFDGIKDLSENYGGELHDTGYMSAFYADLDPMLARGSDMPFSIEPGGPAPNLMYLKKMLGLWFSEGCQSVDYFMHIGNILWNDDMRNYFETHQNQIHLIGKYHAPKAQVAELYSSTQNALVSFPWGSNPNHVLAAGYFAWNVAAYLKGRCDVDAISPNDFANGRASAYKVIIDGNTSVLSPALAQNIEAFVRAGGVFVTYAQTGRHAPTSANSWPISRLTGYGVARVDALDQYGNPSQRRALRLANGQNVFDTPSLLRMNEAPANGLSLVPISGDTHDLLLWQDGTTAAGYRQLGNGYVVQIGCKWTGTTINDRIEPSGTHSQDRFGANGQDRALTTLIRKIMDWQKIPAIPGHTDPFSDDILFRHYVSNNGLYDVWTLWNQSQTLDSTVNLMIDTADANSSAIDVDTGTPLPIENLGGRFGIRGVTLTPEQTRIFLTPRNNLAVAPARWFDLQRNWWRASRVDPVTLPTLPRKVTADLTDGWSWKAVGDGEDVEAIAHETTQDPTWEQTSMGIFTLPNHPDVSHAVYQKAFTVPESWNSGTVSLWIQNHREPHTFYDNARVWVDGKLVTDWTPSGLAGNTAGGALVGGTSHVLTIEVKGRGDLLGIRGDCWLYWTPKPTSSIDLSGTWGASNDFLHYDDSVTIPGPINAFTVRRMFDMPSDITGQNVMLSVNAPAPVIGTLINGHWVSRNSQMLGDKWTINITPWVKPGQSNTIEVSCHGGPAKTHIDSVSIDMYPATQFP